MKRMSKKALLSEARRLNAIDLTHDRDGCKKGRKHFTKIVYSEGVDGCCNAYILVDEYYKIYVITGRTNAFWIYGF